MIKHTTIDICQLGVVRLHHIVNQIATRVMAIREPMMYTLCCTTDNTRPLCCTVYENSVLEGL